MKAIIHAAGSGPQMYPATLAVGGSSLAVYDKPLIYYSLSLLMSAGIRNVLIIAPSRDLTLLAALVGDGRQWGISVGYAEQSHVETSAEVILLAEKFAGNSTFAVTEASQIIAGATPASELSAAMLKSDAHALFTARTSQPSEHTTVSFDAAGAIQSLEPHRIAPKSHWVAVGLRVLGHSVMETIRTMKRGTRGSVTMAEVDSAYLARRELSLHKLAGDTAWFDTASPEGSLAAANYAATLERVHGQKIGCPEEVAFRRGYITAADLERQIAERYAGNAYGRYLRSLIGGT